MTGRWDKLLKDGRHGLWLMAGSSTDMDDCRVAISGRGGTAILVRHRVWMCEGCGAAILVHGGERVLLGWSGDAIKGSFGGI